MNESWHATIEMYTIIKLEGVIHGVDFLEKSMVCEVEIDILLAS